jgi:hypothetical protein
VLAPAGVLLLSKPVLPPAADVGLRPKNPAPMPLAGPVTALGLQEEDANAATPAPTPTQLVPAAVGLLLLPELLCTGLTPREDMRPTLSAHPSSMEVRRPVPVVAVPVECSCLESVKEWMVSRRGMAPACRWEPRPRTCDRGHGEKAQHTRPGDTGTPRRWAPRTREPKESTPPSAPR